MNRVLACFRCCRRRPPPPDGELCTILRSDIAADYDLLDTIGQGKTCVVVRAKAKATGHVVAVKRVATEYLSTPSRVDALSTELRVLSSVRGHPHMLSLVAVYQDDAFVSIVTEYIPAGHVFDVFQEQSSVTEHTIRCIVREVVDVLVELHKKGITHRDIKPENILLDAAGHVRVIDFGIAHTDKNMTGLNGTGPFLAPEVFSSTYSSKVDIWALGVTTFVLLTGHFPFEAPFMSQMEDMIRLGQYSLPSGAQLSMHAQSFVATCLLTDAAKRPSAKALLSHPWLNLNTTLVEYSTPLPQLPCLHAYSTHGRCRHQLTR
ncbi:CAMK/PHK protein kinase [Saprolegnia parasitica CBS 223.65]|uniref:CAMK/PHK protein kinase n=1 Tax=Saprolegnia parasitica (strain CBS 223.65) TaxID=695850 RepID=A0A067CPZ0_SAPPC|nr:CAMK/PHK protein kinase [Saprolegnia parasitica CBS 223.65]KDO32578.1 CAMK/PHK protein kinase [Saprolegnia parasitica CBS 223.65]|eukprot:XP_012197023.1 CAMK/PHK protein kinase [Saprolegnia parasitica CBS 223.65]